VRTASQTSTSRLLRISAATLLAACAACVEAPNAPAPAADGVLAAQFAKQGEVDMNRVLATLQGVTARYHNLDAAIADGFFLLHPCEERPGEGPVGVVYVHLGRLLDGGVINPELPEALIYEPSRNGRPKLVGVEFAIHYGDWTGQEPPQYLGANFQPEDEFGVWALHVWVWRSNPEGLFAESNPRVSCSAE
jgi:hypothetical protein